MGMIQEESEKIHAEEKRKQSAGIVQYCHETARRWRSRSLASCAALRDCFAKS